MKNLKSFWIVCLIGLGLAGSSAAQVIPADTVLRLRLTSGLNTDVTRVGDKVSAQVLSPQAFAGDFIEGAVRKSKSSGKVKGKSELTFTFQTIYHQGMAISISSQVTSLWNSKGQLSVDDEGRAMKSKNNLGKVALLSLLGAGIGAVAGGGRGAAIGAGAGAAVAIVAIQMGAKGERIVLEPGSEVQIVVRQIQ